MVGNGFGRLTRPPLALSKVRRLALVMVLTGVLVQLVAGVALAAESRVLDQATCEDPNPWGAGSQIDDGVWDAGSSTCDSDWAIVKLGDELTIPAGVTLEVGEDLQVLDGGKVTNHGQLVGEGLWIEASSSLYNYGGILTGEVNIQDGSIVDNFGSVTTYFTWLEADSTFLIRCGSFFDAEVINGHDSSSLTTDPAYRDPTYEECAPATTEPATTTTAPPATTEPATTTTVVEVVAEQILPKTGAGDAGSQGLLALALVLTGLAILALTASVTRSED